MVVKGALWEESRLGCACLGGGCVCGSEAHVNCVWVVVGFGPEVSQGPNGLYQHLLARRIEAVDVRWVCEVVGKSWRRWAWWVSGKVPCEVVGDLHVPIRPCVGWAVFGHVGDLAT